MCKIPTKNRKRGSWEETEQSLNQADLAQTRRRPGYPSVWVDQCDLISHHFLLLLVLIGANCWLPFVKDETLTCEAAAIKTNVHFIWVLGLHVTLPSIMYQRVGCWERGGGSCHRRGVSNLQHHGDTNKNRTLKLYNRPSITDQSSLEVREVSFCFFLAFFALRRGFCRHLALVVPPAEMSAILYIRDAFLFTFAIRITRLVYLLLLPYHQARFH